MPTVILTDSQKWSLNLIESLKKTKNTRLTFRYFLLWKNNYLFPLRQEMVIFSVNASHLDVFCPVNAEQKSITHVINVTHIYT